MTVAHFSAGSLDLMLMLMRMPILMPMPMLMPMRIPIMRCAVKRRPPGNSW